MWDLFFLHSLILIDFYLFDTWHGIRARIASGPFQRLACWLQCRSMARENKRLFGRLPKGLSCGIFYRLSSGLLTWAVEWVMFISFISDFSSRI